MFTYGDEIGMEGEFGEDGRRPMPWDESRWDAELFDAYRGLISARNGSVALREGGLRWVFADDDALVFLRESPEEVALVHCSRAGHEPLTLRTAGLAGIEGGVAAYGGAEIGPNSRRGHDGPRGCGWPAGPDLDMDGCGE